ncbi:hypothetical protein B9Z19DRAFT_1071499 [Tuber borchii]|uniref:NAD(P)-binding protein n=1 Tax=Tuber borchii TaxID=42251 RepID=A0A2T7A838_TUBBO|nr:hypothetical protein B9Z19DRAFT_1071499 [Tuber borchii]
MNPQVILVTGANKGIGYGIVRSLLTSAPSHSIIYLTSRDVSRGQRAVTELSAIGGRSSNLVYHQLDITDEQSIDTLVNKIRNAHGRLDVLVNNASIAGTDNELMVDVNYYGTLMVCKKFLPILDKEHGRIVTIGSAIAHLAAFENEEIRNQLGNPELTIEELSALMDKYKADCKAGKASENGWPMAYAVTKAGETALSGILARKYPSLLINVCCPGWVNTEMGASMGGKPPKTIDEGAKIPVRLAINDLGGISGGFWENPSVMDTGVGSISVW